MKRIKIYLPLLILVGMFTACQKFVDVKRNSNLRFIGTSNDCQLLLDNYTAMNAVYPVDAELSADNYFTTTRSYQTDVQPVITAEEQAFYSWQPNAIRAKADASWLTPYSITATANLVLETLDKLDLAAEDPAKINTLRGTALFYRAYSLWLVAQMYAKPYSATTAQDPGVPVRKSSDINEKSSRGTVQGTYDSIISDLLKAIELLPPTSSIATRPNKAAAYAMLARTYLSMEDYPNALINADASIKIKGDLLDYNTISKISSTPFIRYNKEVLFHAIMFRSAILSPGIATTNTAKIDPELVASYNTNDLRSKIFLKPNSVTVILDDPNNPVTLPDGTYRFTGNYEQASTSVQFTGLAVDEMYLTRAECYVRTAKVKEAVDDLNALLKMRWATGTYTNLRTQITADEALSKILEERRKELLMRGLRWTDLRRLNKDPRFKKDLIRQTKNITFTGTVSNPVRVETVAATYTLPANDPRYVLLIPQNVINNSTMEQNTR
jgi:tetratricopeptide (TPR) repeat protein